MMPADLPRQLRAVAIERLEGRCHYSTGTSPTFVPTKYPPNWPDLNIAAGPNEVITSTNVALRFFDKASGANLGALPLNKLFTNSQPGGPFNPRLVFDADTGHFIVSAIEHAKFTVGAPHLSFLDIAASRTASPTANPADWFIFRVNETQRIAGVYAPLDFDALGYDSQAIYVTANLLPIHAAQAVGADVFTFKKSLIEEGLAFNSTLVPSPTKPSQTLYVPGGYSLTPAVTQGYAPVEYLVEAQLQGAIVDQVRIHAISNPLTAISDSTCLAPIDAYLSNLPNAPQKGSKTVVQTLDSSILNVVFSNGSLWFGNTVSPVGSNKTEAAWYQVYTGNWTGGATGQRPITVNEGRIDGGAGIYTFFPSIGVDALGNMVIGYMESSADSYVSAYYCARTSVGDMGQPTLLAAGKTTYYWNRWGDYTGTVADPTLAGVFYTSGQYTLSLYQWATTWTRYAFPNAPLRFAKPARPTDGNAAGEIAMASQRRTRELG